MRPCNVKNILFSIFVALSFVSAGAFAKDSKKEPSHYPNATRSEPKNDLSKESDQKTLQKGIDALNSGDDAKAKEEMQKLLDSSSSKYAKGVALQVMANIKFNNQDYKGAIEDYKKLVELNSLPNDGHFDAMYNMANAYVASEQYPPALEELKVWREQGKRETADSYALEGNIYYRLEKYPEAIAAIKKAQSMTNEPKDSWNSILVASYSQTGQTAEASALIERQLAKDPNNSKLLYNAVVTLVQSNQHDKALALLDKSKSSLDGETQYKLYRAIGAGYSQAGNDAKALDAFAKASPLSKDGEIDYYRGSLLLNNDRAKDAVAALNEAVRKGGLKEPGKAYLMLGDAYNQIDDMVNARAAWQKAKAYPYSQQSAEQRLKSGTKINFKPKKK